MQINGAISSLYESSLGCAVARNRSWKADADDGSAGTLSRDLNTVDIIPEALRLASSETDHVAEFGGANEAPKDNQDHHEKPFISKSFFYGVVGLERAEEIQNRKTNGYDLGRWLAAGVTIGTIISVLVCRADKMVSRRDGVFLVHIFIDVPSGS